MKLHIFNPEHDISLARNTADTSLPKAAVQIRKQYCHVPAYYADDGDIIVAEDKENAAERLRQDGREHAKVKFLTLNDLSLFNESDMPEEIVPWGWDRSIARILVKTNPLFAKLIPDDGTLNEIRRLSSRVFAMAEVLPRLTFLDKALVGEMSLFTGTKEELVSYCSKRQRIVLKAPWSSSGRGVIFVPGKLTENDIARAANILRNQGGILIEPFYDKLLDFAMEFFADKNSGVRYLGLSVFNTKQGAYKGNIIDTEENKTNIVKRYIPVETIGFVRNIITETTSHLFRNRYSGPFGIDMMVVNTAGGIALHPCVELNLRYTMGHVSLLRSTKRK